MRGGGFRNTYIADLDFPGGSVVKNLPVDAGDARDAGLIPGSGRSPGVRNGNPLWYSCPECSVDRKACQATARRSQRVEPD